MPCPGLVAEYSHTVTSVSLSLSISLHFHVQVGDVDGEDTTPPNHHTPSCPSNLRNTLLQPQAHSSRILHPSACASSFFYAPPQFTVSLREHISLQWRCWAKLLSKASHRPFALASRLCPSLSTKNTNHLFTQPTFTQPTFTYHPLPTFNTHFTLAHHPRTPPSHLTLTPRPQPSLSIFTFTPNRLSSPSLLTVDLHPHPSPSILPPHLHLPPFINLQHTNPTVNPQRQPPPSTHHHPPTFSLNHTQLPFLSPFLSSTNTQSPFLSLPLFHQLHTVNPQRQPHYQTHHQHHHSLTISLNHSQLPFLSLPHSSTTNTQLPFLSSINTRHTPTP